MIGDLRVVAIADADSFVKWSAALLDSVPDIRRHLLLVRTPLTVSKQQEQIALAGTSLGEGAVTRVGFDEVAGWLGGHLPDVVVLAGRGPFVRLMMRQIDRLPHRPVTLSGLPGMSIPAQRGAMEYRRESDLLVVHSHREERAFTELGRRLGMPVPSALATLPYVQASGTPVRSRSSMVGLGARADAGTRVTTNRPLGGVAVAERPRVGTDLVFAAQALVPVERHERAALVSILRRAANADPTRRVVVKLRSRPGEAETHLERDAYAELLTDRPKNLVLSYEPMATALSKAEGLVTISSTAAVEAIARGIPVIALNTFGVSKPLLNTVFVGSGLIGDADDVVARRFRHPEPDWMHDNYFHPAAESDWWSRTQELVALRRAGVLPAKRVPVGRGGTLHAAWHRKSVLGTEDRSLAGHLALGVGAPAVRAIVGLRRARGRAGEDTWADASTDYTIEPTPHQDPVRR
ncbi:hypothetical protein DC31_03720 [Microbacterium sp. CH12i]|uniref:DUF6716 putative glycosyltransferase n=1 Tax=Microbacterium sp. CH12i TaxID=1479651 RepID=UPI0004617AA5|nr:DUF6716 putative glycosyltransferase [Microbacterium sp. CH12i]KDA05256.1 hypothetical protein DC31_03720 [Microbacterium sp. CH12i]